MPSASDSFCGGVPLWDGDLTWNTPDPEFTACFHQTVLSWTPAAILLLSVPFEASKVAGSRNRNTPIGWRVALRFLLTLAAAVASVARLVMTFTEDAAEVAAVEYVTSSVFVLAFSASLLLQVVAIRRGLITSGGQFLFYAASVFCGAFTVRYLARRHSDAELQSESETPLILFSVQYVCVCALFVLSLFADGQPKQMDERLEDIRQPCPINSASFLSRLLFLWPDSFVWSGFRKPLEVKDLWELNPDVATTGIVPLFEHHYDRSKRSAAAKKSAKATHSVIPALFFSFGASFFMGAVLRLACDLLAMLPPQVMKAMINYVTKMRVNDALPDDEKVHEWQGYFYAGLIFAVLFVKAILEAQYYERMYLLGMNLRTALTSSIYKKSLVLSSASRKVRTVGEAVNLMSVDVQIFMDLLPYVNMVWSAPIQIGLSIFLIERELGKATYYGIAVLAAVVPINAVVGALTGKFYKDMMKLKDRRNKQMSEVLSGSKVLKLYGWEESFVALVAKIRKGEIGVLKKMAYNAAVMDFIWVSVPFLISLAFFVAYLFVDGGNVLTPEKAFVSSSYIWLMTVPMSIFPMLLMFTIQAGISMRRINTFLNSEETPEDAISHDSEEREPLIIEEGTFRWGKEEPVVLSDIDLKVSRGSLTAIVGAVGSGKSSLVSAFLGDLEKDKGRVNVYGSLGYVPQQAWIRNATLKDNVVMCSGDEVDDERYERVIEACALRADLKILTAGDQTEIGEKGINLSGGQKQRVSLARACYNDPDVYLFDDPLSAVDSHVGKHIFDEVIGPNGLLNRKTRVLVTHGITYLPSVDHIVVIKDGKISEQGSYRELLAKKGAFADFLLEYMAEAGEAEEDIGDIMAELKETMGNEGFNREFARQASIVSEGKAADKEKAAEKTTTREDAAADQTETNKKKGALIEEETAATGAVGRDVYMYYFKSIGLYGVAFMVFMQVIYQASTLGTSLWMEAWTGNKVGNATEYQNRYISVYAALGLVQGLANLILSIVMSLSTLKASRKLHDAMLKNVIRAPMAFFDTTPIGRIINRFSKDISACDSTLPQLIGQWMFFASNFLGTIILITLVLPLFAAAIIPISFLFLIVQHVYVATSRQLKRLESITRSPIYTHFGESLSGISTIRAFGLQDQLIRESHAAVDKNVRTFYPSVIANRWLGVRLDIIGCAIVFITAIIAVSNTSLLPSELGLVLSYSFSVTQMLMWMVRMTADIETNIVAVERIKEYTNVETEAEWKSESPPEKEWPEKGEIAFSEYSMRYRPGLDLVVKGLDCKVKGGEKVGLVGRTGAGKSSLTVALFRLVEAAAGSITIDGIDISKLGLHELRHKLTIIPQDPVLFAGSLRMNLDPFDSYQDENIWKVLELSRLKDFVSGLEDGLDHTISEGGENLSVGQRQLVCLGRALLRKSKVLILDEATAAVDLETDEFIQSTIRKEFAGCTVLTIAHRLNTIMDYDKIMVLDKGRLVEFAPPQQLLDDATTVFHSMAKDAGLVQ